MNLMIDRGMHPIFDRALGFSSFDEAGQQQTLGTTNQASQSIASRPAIGKDRGVDLGPNDPNLQEHRRF